MKTFTEAERREIQRRIEAASGMKFDGCRPECFLDATASKLKSLTVPCPDNVRVQHACLTYLGDDSLHHHFWFGKFILN